VIDHLEGVRRLVAAGFPVDGCAFAVVRSMTWAPSSA
jgi:hypothetical protein